MDKIKTEAFIDYYRKTDKSQLYDKFIHNDINIEKYNQEDYNELIINNMLLYYLLYGEEKLSELGGIKLDIPSSVKSLKDFRREIEKYKSYKAREPYIKNLYEEILHIYAKKILSTKYYSWTKIYSEKTTGEKSKKMGKIYLPVNNKHLHQFATQLFQKCLKYNINDYQFKISDNDDITRKDNLVIYFTQENFSTYIEAIEEIITENPFIKFDESNFLAYQYSEHIAVAKDFSDVTSYTDILCNLIEYGIEQNLSTIEIVEKLESFTNEKLKEVILLCEETKKGHANKKR